MKYAMLVIWCGKSYIERTQEEQYWSTDKGGRKDVNHRRITETAVAEHVERKEHQYWFQPS